MLKYHFLPLKSRLKKASQSKLYGHMMKARGMENTMREFGNMKIHICRSSIKNEEVLQIVPPPECVNFTESNKPTRSLSFIHFNVVSSRQNDSESNCLLYSFKATLIMTCLQLSS